MTDETRSPDEVQRIMDAAFFAYVDQLQAQNPGQSYNYCFTLALQELYVMRDGDASNAPALPGTGRLDDMFGEAAVQVETYIAEKNPDKSPAWHREMTELILLGEDEDE